MSTSRPAAVDPHHAAFTAFVTDAGPGLRRTARLLTGDDDRAEELVQQALVKTYLAWPRAQATNPEAYARRVLANQRIDTWRKQRREVLADPADVPDSPVRDAGDPVADDAADRDEIARALMSLTPRQRRVVVLRHLVGLTDAEVAADLGVSVGTVKSTASRGLAQLRADLLPDRAAADDDVLSARLAAAGGAAAAPSAAGVVRGAAAVRGRRRRTLAAAAVAVLAVVGVSVTGTWLQRTSAPPAGDWPLYGSLDALAEAADVVVEGTVLDEGREDVDIDLGPREDLMAMIVYRLRVERSHLGDAAPGEVVEVNVMASDAGPTVEPRLSVGERYVLFLGESFDGRPRPLVNPYEAAYRLADDDALVPLADADGLAPTITRAELEALRP